MLILRNLRLILGAVAFVLATNIFVPWIIYFLLAGGFFPINYEVLHFSNDVFLDLRILTIITLLSPLLVAIYNRRWDWPGPVKLFLSLWPFAVAIALILSPTAVRESALNPFKVFLLFKDPLMEKTELAPNFTFEKFNRIPNSASEEQVLALLGKAPYSIYYDPYWRYSKSTPHDDDYWQIMVLMKEDGVEKKIKFNMD